MKNEVKKPTRKGKKFQGNEVVYQDNEKVIIKAKTTGALITIDAEDYPLVKHLTWHINDVNKNYYVRSTYWIAGRKYTVRLARLIMGFPEDKVVDHINRDTLDNRKSNLRLCSQAENCCNRKPKATRNNKYTGVQKARNKFKSMLYFENKRYYLGLFDTEREAAIAYNHKAIEIHGEFAVLNEVG